MSLARLVKELVYTPWLWAGTTCQVLPAPDKRYPRKICIALEVSDSKLICKLYQIGEDIGHCRQHLKAKKKRKIEVLFLLPNHNFAKVSVRWLAYVVTQVISLPL